MSERTPDEEQQLRDDVAAMKKAMEEEEHFGPIHLWHPEVGWVSDESPPERKRAMLDAMKGRGVVVDEEGSY